MKQAMYKWISLVLILGLLTAALSGCAQKDSQLPETTANAVEPLTETQPATEQAAEGAVQVLSPEKDAQLHADLQAHIDAIVNSETEIVHSDTFIPGKTYTGKAYYVSSDGDDSNDGLTPETAWGSMGKVLQEVSWGDPKVVQPGDAIFFRRGDTFRFTDWALSCQVDNVTYSAYGEGEKPIFTASSENGAGQEKWELVYQDDTGKKIWKFYRDMRDTASVIINDGEYITDRVYEFYTGTEYISCIDVNWCAHDNYGVELLEELLPLEESLTEDMTIISRPVLDGSVYPEAGPLYLRCDAGNPGELYGSIEFSEKEIQAIIWQPANGNVFDNISFRCNGNSYIKTNPEAQGMVIQNCEFAYGGGSVTDYTINEYGHTVGVQGDGIYGYTADTVIQNCYFHDSWAPTVTYEGSVENPPERYSGSYQMLDNVIVNTYGIRLDSSAEYLSYMDSVVIRGNQIWNTGRMDRGKFTYAEGSILLMVNHYGECIIEDNVLYGTEQGYRHNALLNLFDYEFEAHGNTRPALANNTYVQYKDRNFADFDANNQDFWTMDDPQLTQRVAEVLGDTTSEFYIIEN